MGWGGFLDQLFKKLPIQDRKERIKNKIEDLEKKRNEIMSHPANDKDIARVERINVQLKRLRDQISNFE